MHSEISPISQTPAAGTPWTIAVLGPGGIGGLLAAILARAGHRVICLAGNETVGHLNRNGTSLESSQHGDFIAPVEADTVLRERVDLCLITVKQTALHDALERVPSEVLRDGLVLPLLNGIDHIESLRTGYPSATVVPGVIRAASTRLSPGVIVHGSPFTEIDVAGDHDRINALTGVLQQAGVTVQVYSDESEVMWSKLAFLAPFALLTTRYQASIGTVRTRYRHELEALVAETTAVSTASGVHSDSTVVLERYDTFPFDSESSMQRDAAAGRPLELDAIGGALLRAAQRHGVPVPLITRLVSEVAATTG